MKLLKNDIKVFFYSFLGTSLVFALCCGFVIVEKNTRYIAFGDTSPFFIFKHEKLIPYFLKIHFMGGEYTLLRVRKYTVE